jgi:hypothetical protein
MHTLLKAALAASLLAASGASPSLGDQSVDAFAASHFNRSMSAQERQTEPGTLTARSSGSILGFMSRGASIGKSRSQQAAEHFNRSVSAQERQTVIRSAKQPNPELDAFAAEHFNRQVRSGDRQSY